VSFRQKSRKTRNRRLKTTLTAYRGSNRNLHHKKLGLELLEDWRLLSIDSPQFELFNVSPALFVENQGQWADASIRYLHQGNGANVAMTDAGPVFHVFRQETVDGSTPAEKSAPELPGLENRFKPDDTLTQTLQF
jgi:hypothetical protein